MTDISGSDSGAETPSLDVISSSQTQHSPAAVVFAASLAQWPIFPDTPAALARLSTFGLRLAVLSNVDRTSFTHTRVALERSGGFAFGAVYTAEDIGSYKSVADLSSRCGCHALFCWRLAAVIRHCSLTDYENVIQARPA